MTEAAKPRRLPASMLLPLISGAFGLVYWAGGFPDSGTVLLVCSILPVCSLYMWLLSLHERSEMEQAYNSIDVYRHGIRLTAKNAQQIHSQRFVDRGVALYETLFRAESGAWFLAQIERALPRGGCRVADVRLLSPKQARKFLESTPAIYETWFGNDSPDQPQDEESNPRMVSSLYPGSTIRTFEDGNEHWKCYAYPLKLITIQAQGTSDSTRDSLIKHLEEALAQVKAGGSSGVEYDDDVGYRFEAVENMELTIFPGTSHK